MKRLIQKLSVIFVIALLAACKPEIGTNNTAAEPLSVVEQKNAQEWEDHREYVTENNYVIREGNSGKPAHFIYKAQEWPREDLNDKSSYDLPRVMFRWNNMRYDIMYGAQTEEQRYEARDKIWSIKTDGTDLRLVTDDFNGSVRVMRRSPDNRYLAYAYGHSDGMFKILFDLKTQTSTVLGQSRGKDMFLWAEDSSYVYFADNRSYWKYDIATQKKEEVDIHFSNHSVIYQGKRYVVSDYGVVVYDESKNERLYSVGVESSDPEELERFLSDHDYRQRFSFLKRSISPTGRYAWAESQDYRFLIDTHTKTFKQETIIPRTPGKFRFFELISLDAKYVRNGAGLVFLFKLNDEHELITDDYIRWGQIGTGQSATDSALYNAFANNGDFVKEVIHE
ncbi:Tricorn protease domain-containing protein [Vibrio sp. Of7-15]|uniref:TolB family protein n=1 Tax=Vibrio sp. Of7-15 TaxID=2724879 RepID=UPI001EF24EDC|nr:Tricorn protease domain-containing protein [Vibrio sp. Of7-15]MCG7495259.1 Tricorn protease domain-containing protein [Vibrio sp. Of7-15]